MIIYIAGPISSDTCYKAKFDTVDNALAVLRQADAAVFLPGWEHSPGACLEHLYCETVGIEILSDDKEVSF